MNTSSYAFGLRRHAALTVMLWGCMLCAAHAVTHADSLGRADTLHTRHLHEAVVSAPRSLPADGVTPAQVLKGEALMRLSALSVADALRYFSGLQIKDYGGIGGLKTINVRSMGTNHTAVSYDGIVMGNAQNGQTDLGRLSLDNVEAVGLYNGLRTGTLLTASDYGSAAHVYIETRKPAFALGQRRRVVLRQRLASFDTYNAGVLWEQLWGKTLTSSFNAEYLTTSGRYEFRYRTLTPDGATAYDTTAVRHNGDVQAWRAEWLWGNVQQSADWRAKIYVYTSERGLPGAIVRGRFVHEDRQWDTNLFGQASWQKAWRRYSLKLNGKYAFDYLRYLSDPRRDAGVMYVDNRYRQHEVFLSAAQQWLTHTPLTFSVATDYRMNKLDANLSDFAYPTRHTWLAATAVHYHTAKWRAQASCLYNHVYDLTRTGLSGATTRRLTPFLAVTFQPNALTEWRVFGKSSFRMPTLNDLYYTFIGNIGLRPETATQWNVGGTWRLPIVHVEADVYHNKINNKIVAVPTSNQFRWTMTNLGEVSIWGADIKATAERRLAEAFSVRLRLTYTYQKAVDVTSPSDSYYKHQIAYIPRHSGSAVVGAQWRTFWAHYSFIYTGERYDQQANIAENYVPAWYTSDISAGCRLMWRGKPLNISAEINNVFNQRYEVVKGYPMPGTNLSAKVSYEF